MIIRTGELFLFGAHFSPLPAASTHISPDPTRTRKLLLHANEISKLIGGVERKGYTLVPPVTLLEERPSQTQNCSR